MRTIQQIACVLLALLSSSNLCFGDYLSTVHQDIVGNASGGDTAGGNHTDVSNSFAGASEFFDYQLSGTGIGYAPGVVFDANAGAHIFGSVAAQPGALKLSVNATAQATQNQPSRNLGDYANASFTVNTLTASYTDDITVTKPGYARGRSVTLHAIFLLDGVFIADAGAPDPYHPARANVALYFSGTGIATLPQYPVGGAFDSNNPNDIAYNDPPITEFPVSVTFQAGIPTTVSYTLRLTGDGFAGVEGGGINTAGDPIPPGSDSMLYGADFSHTAKWGGITDVLDDSGQPLDGFTITSTSGFDYTHAVPEPSTLALALLSIPGWLAFRRALRKRF